MENTLNKPKRIAIVIWELDLCGGTQRLALELARAIKNMGHDVDIFAHYFDQNKGFTDKFKDLNIYGVTDKKPLKTGKIGGSLSMFLKIYGRIIKVYFRPEKTTSDLAKLIKETSKNRPYDCINMHDYEAYKIARILHHENMVWTMNDIQRPKLNGKNIIHNTLFNFLQRIVVKKEIKNIRDIVVLDNRNTKLCREYYKRGSTVVRGGMDVRMFEGKTKPRDFKKETYSIFLSSIFFPWRRFEDAIDAVEILTNRGQKNFRVHINGITDRAPKYYESIQKRITEKNLSSYIHITPGMSEQRLIEEYVNTDIFIFPNHNQTWGLAVFEAMLAGCATIVSTTSGASEILTDKENALLVPPQSPEHIANAIELLTSNGKMFEKLSKNGSEFVTETLSWDRYAHECLRVF